MNNLVKETQASSGAYFVLFGAQLAVGAAAIFARYAMHSSGPLVVSALRLTIASSLITLLAMRSRQRVTVTGKHEVLFALCGLAAAAHFATWMASLLFTSVAVSTLLVSTAPVWTALYDVFVLKRKQPAIFWIGFVAAAIGCILVVTATATGQFSSPGPGSAIGALLAAAGGLSFAGYLIAIRSVSSVYPTVIVVGRTYSWAAACLWIGAFALHQGVPPLVDVKSWAGILGLALVSQMLGHTGINASLKWFAPNVVALSTLVEPVCAALLAAVIFKEVLSLQTIIGSVVLLSALAIVLSVQEPVVELEISKMANEL